MRRRTAPTGSRTRDKRRGNADARRRRPDGRAAHGEGKARHYSHRRSPSRHGRSGSLLGAAGAGGRPETAAEARDERGQEIRVRKRLFTDDRQDDDEKREHLFRQEIEDAGHSCDSVTPALMSSAGKWAVSCEPGYVYAFSYETFSDTTS